MSLPHSEPTLVPTQTYIQNPGGGPNGGLVFWRGIPIGVGQGAAGDVMLAGSGSDGDGSHTVAVANAFVVLGAGAAIRRLHLQADPVNLGVVMWGSPTVALGTSKQLAPGQYSPEIQIQNVTLIFVSSTVAGDIIRYFYQT